MVKATCMIIDDGRATRVWLDCQLLENIDFKQIINQTTTQANPNLMVNELLTNSKDNQDTKILNQFFG